MSRRRAVLAGTATLALSLGAGCIEAVTDRLGLGRRSLSATEQGIVEAYERGIDEFNAGVGVWDSAIAAFNESEYGSAVEGFEAAVDRFRDARTSFTEARVEALDIDNEGAARVCDDATERAKLMLDSARAGSDGAQAALEGASANRINEHVRDTRELEEEASQLEIRDSERLVSLLEDG